MFTKIKTIATFFFLLVIRGLLCFLIILSMSAQAATIGYVCPDQLDAVPEEARTQQHRKRFLRLFEEKLDALKPIVTDGHPISIFLSHGWHVDALDFDRQNNRLSERQYNDLLPEAQYYDSLCWWLYDTLIGAGFEVAFDKKQKEIRDQGVESFMAKNVDAKDIVLSVCTKLYHDRSLDPGTGVSKEVQYIKNRIEREGMSFFVPLLVHYADKNYTARELLPRDLQTSNPIYVDLRSRDRYVTNMWCVLAELYNAKSRQLGQGKHAADMKMAYVNTLGSMRDLPDLLNVNDGTQILVEESSRIKDRIFNDLYRITKSEVEKYSLSLKDATSGTRLDEIRELRKYFRMGYLEVTTDNYEKLEQYSKTYESSFNAYDRGVYLKKWKASQDVEKLLDFLVLFDHAQRFKIEVDWDKQDVNIAEMICCAIQYYPNLTDLIIPQCQLTDIGLGYIIESLQYPNILQTLDIRDNPLLTASILLKIREKCCNLTDIKTEIKTDNESSKSVSVISSLKLPPPSTVAVKENIDRPMSTPIPEIARGHEEVYLRFIKGKLIYKLPKGWLSSSREPDIEIPFSALSNPLEGAFDLSRCGYISQYISIATGYRKGKIPANENKLEVWIVPKFVIEKELSTTARHLAPIMGSFTSDVGIFWTWGSWDNSAEKMGWYDYLTDQNFDKLSNGENLYEKWHDDATTGDPVGGVRQKFGGLYYPSNMDFSYGGRFPRRKLRFTFNFN